MVEKTCHFLALDDSLLINQGTMNPRTHTLSVWFHQPEKTACFLPERAFSANQTARPHNPSARNHDFIADNRFKVVQFHSSGFDEHTGGVYLDAACSTAANRESSKWRSLKPSFHGKLPKIHLTTKGFVPLPIRQVIAFPFLAPWRCGSPTNQREIKEDLSHKVTRHQVHIS